MLNWVRYWENTSLVLTERINFTFQNDNAKAIWYHTYNIMSYEKYVFGHLNDRILPRYIWSSSSFWKSFRALKAKKGVWVFWHVNEGFLNSTKKGRGWRFNKSMANDSLSWVCNEALTKPVRRACLSLAPCFSVREPWWTRKMPHAPKPGPNLREDRSSFTWDLVLWISSSGC